MQRAVTAGILWGVVGLAAAVGAAWLVARPAEPAILASPAGSGGAPDGRRAQQGAGREVYAQPALANRAEQVGELFPAGSAPLVGQAEPVGQAEQVDPVEPVGQAAVDRAGLPPAAHPLADYQPMHVEPVEPIIPAPPEDVPELWRPLHETVYAVAAEYPGRISVVAVDLTTGSRYEFRARDPYLPASTFKLPVALCVLEAIDAGEMAWDTLVTYTEEDYEPVGAGGFAQAAFGSRWTVRNLVDRSLISSNNVAVKMLARTLTWDGLLACTTAMGGPVTRTEEGSTPVSAADEAAWWLRLWELSRERPELAEQLLRPLRQATYRGRIQAGTPRPELVTHKFGTYAGYDHDGGIVWAERPYALVVLTYGGGEYLADRAIERIAAAAWASVMGDAAGR